MELTTTINESIKAAMKDKDQARLRALRAIKSALLLAQTEKADVVIDAGREIQLLQKLAKQRRDSMVIYEGQNRMDLYQIEKEELEVIETFLPKALDAETLALRIGEVIKEMGAKGLADLPKVMPKAMQAVAGQADNKSIADVVKKLLAG